MKVTLTVAEFQAGRFVRSYKNEQDFKYLDAEVRALITAMRPFPLGLTEVALTFNNPGNPIHKIVQTYTWEAQADG